VAEIKLSSEDTLREYRTLLERQELAHLNLVGVVIHAVGNLNLGDPPAALRTLMLGLEMCVEADGAIEAFRRKHYERKQTQSDKENHDGNATSQSAA
jgi:hypothetical protein